MNITTFLKKILPLLALFIHTGLDAQEYRVPADYTLERAEDYAEYEKDIISCINWLEATAISPDDAMQRQAKMFLMKWLAGSPDVIIELQEYVGRFTKKNPDMLFIFLGGWTKLAIEHPEQGKDIILGNMAGIQSVLRVYRNGKGVKKDKLLEQLAAWDDRGALNAWVQEQVQVKK